MYIQTVVYVFLTSIIFLQGCGLDKSFVKKDMASLSPLTVVRHETPKIKKFTFGGVITGATVGVLLGGGLGASALLDATGKSAGKEAQEKIYDFGYLVMTNFCDCVSNEIPD